MSLRPLFAALAVVLMVVACAVSPTGQRQLLLFPETQMAEMGALAYQEAKQGGRVLTGGAQLNYVRCVTRAITAQLPAGGPQWEVNLFEDDSANAFALPGGKIGVHTGLLKVARNQDQLATVIGHEIAHVLARHANARMSAAYASQATTQVVAALAASRMNQDKAAILGLLGLGAQYGVLLPYGRGQESEADSMGLELMARAGFDPAQAVPLWENMAEAGGGASPPEFLSTHPSHDTRIQRLTAAQAQVRPLYQRARAAGLRPGCG